MAKTSIGEKKKNSVKWIFTIEIIIIVAIVAIFILIKLKDKGKNGNQNPNHNAKGEDINKDNDEDELSEAQKEAKKEQERLAREENERNEYIEKAEKLKLTYDYEGAINHLKSYKGTEGDYDKYKTITDAIEEIEEEKKDLVLYGGSYTSITEFNHIFFHSLIADTSLAFDGDYESTGYNMYMTTIYEFEKMIEKMYNDGYVLVGMHQIASIVEDEDGTKKFVQNEILLPKGKKPFVLSVDDVSYYEYMDGDGFATKLIIDDDGTVVNEMKLEDGSIVRGDFDVSPILDRFVRKHPDFSYKGAKGILALTGYNGVLGYRTNELDSPNYNQDVEEAKKVVEALKNSGWEFASHGWGHRNSLKISDSEFIKDMQRWLDEVEPILGPTDMFIFPFGIEFEQTIGEFTSPKYKFCKENGFDYYFGVEGKPWGQIRKDYIRMNRRPLDGQAMLQFPERLADLFDVKDVIDPKRPERDWD